MSMVRSVEDTVGSHCRTVFLAARAVVPHVQWRFIAGFSLCQAWSAWCFAWYDPMLHGAIAFDLRIAAVCALGFGLFAFCLFHRMARLSSRAVAFWRVVFVACASASCLGPMGEGLFSFPVWLMVVSASCFGFGCAFLYISWLMAFWRRGDNAGIMVSLAFGSLLLYPLAVLAADLLPGLLSSALSCAVVPCLSAWLLFARRPVGVVFEDAGAEKRGFRELGSSDRILLIRYSFALAVVVCVVTLVRGVLGCSARLSLTVPSLCAACLKFACGIGFAGVCAKRDGAAVSAAYRGSFFLVLASVLAMPFIADESGWAFMLLDVGAFCFEGVMLMVVVEMAHAFSLEAVLLFALMRMVWAFASLAGMGAAAILASCSARHIEMIVALAGVACAIAFVALLPDARCARIVARSRLCGHATPFKDKCVSASARAGLSKRESEVLCTMAKGRSASRAASELGVSLSTVNSHISHIYQKMGVHSRQEMIDYIEDSDSSAFVDRL